MPRRPEPLLVLGIVGQYPMAGVAWQAIHYLLGLRQLGWDVYYVEDSGAPPYDPRLGGASGDAAYAVGYVADVMRRIGFADRWVYLDMVQNETHGLPRTRLDALYREAVAIVNLCGATAPRAEHRQGARLVYIETDPVYEQLRIATGATASLDFLAAHDVLFTYGENLGAPDCPVPLERFAWKTTRPPVVLDCWEARTDPAAVHFTSIASWENKGKDITWGGVAYQWTKHVNFLHFLDLPRRTPQRFRLAMNPLDAAVEALQRAVRAAERPRPAERRVEAREGLGQVARVPARVVGEGLGHRVVEPLPGVLEVRDLAAERAEALHVLEVVPGDAADRVGRDQPRDDDLHASPASASSRPSTGAAPKCSAAIRRAAAPCRA